MGKDFEEVWNRYSQERAKTCCPLNDAELDSMVAKAMDRTPFVETASINREQRHRPTIYIALAACLGLLIIPMAGRSNSLTIPTVDYEGQSIKLLCNHGCSADDVVLSLNNYLESL